MIKNEYEYASSERLMAAFRSLDPKGTGRISMEVLIELLTTKGIPFRKEEEDFFR